MYFEFKCLTSCINRKYLICIFSVAICHPNTEFVGCIHVWNTTGYRPCIFVKINTRWQCSGNFFIRHFSIFWVLLTFNLKNLTKSVDWLSMVLKIFFLVSEVGLTWADTLRDTIFPPRKVPRVPCGDFSLHTGGRLLTICKQHKI